jgi:cell shape-determining protein MreC
VENRRSTFRGGDHLILEGVAYHQLIPAGTPVLTTGLGGIFPRGIPIGRIDSVADTQAHWRKSYWLRPMVQPASVTQVLVAVGRSTPEDVSRAWPLDSLTTREEEIDRERARADSLRAMTDSVRLLRGLLEQARDSKQGGS